MGGNDLGRIEGSGTAAGRLGGDGMTRKTAIRLSAVGLIIPLAVWLLDCVQTVHWVGDTDLEVEFRVSDAVAGQPIPGARIVVRSEGGFYKERTVTDYTFVTDDDGAARKVCQDSMCFGTQSGLKFTNTFAVHLPWWTCVVAADGYQSSEPIVLDRIEYRRAVQRIGPGQTKLVVPVTLTTR